MQALALETPAGGIHVARWLPPSGAGRRYPIVLLHDSLGCVALWRGFPEQLAEATGREVIAYDRRGYGKSPPYPGPQPASFIEDEPQQALAEVCERLELQRFVLLGHSVGGGMAIEAAAQHAQACEALVTVAALAYMEPRILTGIREAEQAFTDPEQMARLARYHGDKAERVLRAWIDAWQSEAFRDWQLDETLSRVTCPTLAIHGERDEFGSSDQARHIASSTAGPAQVRILACGHVPHRECPEELAAIVAAFLANTA